METIELVPQVWNTVFSGFSKNPVMGCRYVVLGDKCKIALSPIELGTSNSTIFEFTLPFNSAESIVEQGFRAINNGVTVIASIELTEGSNIAKVTLANGEFWTVTGAKAITEIQFPYRIK